MAMPTDAVARADASFKPSPTMATGPITSSDLMMRTLSSGSSSAWNSSTPACCAMAAVTRRLSPVSMTTLFMPRALSWRTASAASCRSTVCDGNSSKNSAVNFAYAMHVLPAASSASTRR